MNLLIMGGLVAYVVAMYQLCKHGMVGGAQLLLLLTIAVIVFI